MLLQVPEDEHNYGTLSLGAYIIRVIAYVLLQVCQVIMMYIQ